MVDAGRLSIQSRWRRLFSVSWACLKARPDRAIEIAKRGIPLKIATKVDVDRMYSRPDRTASTIPLANSGEIDETQKLSFSEGTHCCFHRLAGTFGLVMIKRCRRNAGHRGQRLGAKFSLGTRQWPDVDSIEAAAEAARRASDMDRRKVRADFERRFTAERMAAAYLAAYRSLLARASATMRLERSMAPPAALELLPPAWEEVAGDCDAKALNPVGQRDRLRNE
jgi:hypothetical protein